jgi:aminoglycoside phosphotransferase (APT) family kinase protein
MYAKPSIDDLIEGVARTLQFEVFPRLADNPDAQTAFPAMLALLDRIGSEWSGMAGHFVADNDAIEQTLAAVAQTVESEPAGADVQRVIASLPAGNGLAAGALADRNHALKNALIAVIEALDLPAAADASEAIRDADAQVRALLQRMCEREVEVDSIDVFKATDQVKVAATPDPIDEITAKLEAFVANEVHGSSRVKVRNLERMIGGQSRDTWFFDVEYVDAAGHTVEDRCVLQEEAVSSVLETDVAPDQITGTRRCTETEFEVIKVAEAAGIAVAHPLWLDSTGEWLGRPFSVSRRVAGSGTDAPLLEDENAEQRRKVFAHFVEVLGALHALDPQEHDLGVLGNPTPESAAAEQIDLFEAGYLKHRLEPHPAIDYMIRWCRKNQPVAAKVSLIHGDFRRGNFLYEGDRVTAVVDWEQCHLGDPHEEIAFNYWPMWTLEPALALEEFIPMYEEASGIEVDRETLAYYRVFIELKMVVVMLIGIGSFFGTDNRLLQYGLMPPGFAAEMPLRFLRELDAGGPTYDYRIASDAVRLV